jgi:predicted lipid carrier protein YhbT
MAEDAADLIGADAETIRDLLAAVDHDELRANLTPELERQILDELFGRFPEYLDPERTGDVETTFAWRVGDRRWVVTIDHGRATVAEGDDPARVTLTLDTVDLLGLVTGTADPALLFFTGRLTLEGDDAFVLELAPYFRAPTHTGEVDPTAVDDDYMAGLIGRVPTDDLRERLQGGLRDVILREVFARFPEYLHLERTKDIEATMKWTLTGRADGDADRWLVHIDHGACTVTEDDGTKPRVTLKLDAADFLKLVTGNANPTMFFLRRRLTVKGDLGFAATLPRLFRMPAAAEE